MPERILIPLDGSEMGESAFRFVEQLVSKLKPEKMPEIILLQVISPEIHHFPVEGGTVDISNGAPDTAPAEKAAMKYLEKAGEGLRNQGITVKCKVIRSEPGASSAQSIIQAEEDMKVDVVAMSTHGRRGLSRWAFGSVTEKVLRGGHVPVIMVRAKE
jgi:nucleotide-binding universal stress UspA family protein